MSRFGIPYRGSKSGIAEWVVANLPPGETFVDLFAGGCAVTHAAMLSGRFTHFVANDIGDGPEIFKAAVNGEFEGYATVPTREEFQASDDPALRLLYSFGNDSTSYLWSRELEPVKVAASRMVMAPSTHERKAAYNQFMRSLRTYLEDGNGMPDHDPRHDGELQRLERLQGLQGLEGLQRLERLQGLQGLEIKHLDYRSVEIPSGSTVYADPPYRGTSCRGYANGGEFDFKAFDAWLAVVPFPVIVSEYTAPDGSVELARKEKRVTMAANSNKQVKTERLFIQERFADEYRERMASAALLD